VRSIVQDESGTIWVGTFGGGLNRMNMERRPGRSAKQVTFRRFKHDPHNPASLSQDLIQSLCVDRDGQIWIGTFGGGLDCFDSKLETFRHLTEENSDLPKNVIYAVLCDDKGRIWMSSNRGISRYDPVSGSVANYDVSDGLQSMEFNGQSAYKARSGEMFFGGINGLNFFFPDSITAIPSIPQVVVTDFRIFDKPVQVGGDSPLQANILETKDIVLPYWQNDLSFAFSALHYNSPGKNRYKYMLENFDAHWRDGSVTRTATYTNLDPGEYVFRVRASNCDGVWNLEGTSIHLVIRPPWWKTVQAYIGYGVIALLLFLGIYRLQHRRITKREREASLLREAVLRASMAEAESRATRAESERVTHELEQARKLQLSLLPRELPKLPDLDIAVHMQTATEVGGDYYDFLVDENGRLTVAIGDATGHGLSAGTMVSLIKCLFVANVLHSDIRHFFHSCTRILKQLRLGNLYMALTLVRIQRGVIEASAAGMPPIYIYRRERGEVDIITLKGMPLGAFDEFVYQDVHFYLNPGDTMLLLSDGLPELFNDRREMYDYGRVCDTFRQYGHMQPQEVINALVSSADKWRNDCLPNDDITFVVLKMKNGPAKAAA
jgi:serine phosphatase RsbU (regulator of sigma subunit)